MRSVLEQLYFGDIQPNAKSYEADSPFSSAAEFKRRNLEHLMKRLDDSGKEVFEKYRNAQEEMESILRYDTFTYALKFGILLMTDVFLNSDEVVGEDLVL